jgi:hypothetical protein
MLSHKHVSRLAGLPVLLLLIAASGLGARSLLQNKPSKLKDKPVRLEYSGDGEPTKVNDDLRPLALPSNRLLVPVGDTLYLLDAENKVVWEHSFEPNVILDFIAAPEGTIYVAVSDGLLIGLGASGKQVWGSNAMCGSANYTQLQNYEGGFLDVISMEDYRASKGSDSEDILEFRKDRKVVWSKEFPRQAELFVWGSKILAVTRTKDGKEIREIK